MRDDTSAPVPRRSITPSRLPLGEQAALYERLKRGRRGRHPKSWQRLAIEEGFAQRTLEDFHRGARELEEDADKRPDAVITEERVGRFIHARAATMPASLSSVPEDFVPPPVRREITPSQLPLMEQATLFTELQEAREPRPLHSWEYIAIEQGFAQRTLEHFYESAMKLERNADKRSLGQILVEQLEARSTAMPVGRRSDRALREVGLGEGRAVDRRRARAEARRRAKEVRSAAEMRHERPREALQPSPASPDPRTGKQDAQDEPPSPDEDWRLMEAQTEERLPEALAAERRRAAERNQDANAGTGGLRQPVTPLEQLPPDPDVTQAERDERGNALWAQSIHARQALGTWLDQQREAALQREQEGLPPYEDEDEDGGEPWDPGWGPMPSPYN
jgi:hypothetical protein